MTGVDPRIPIEPRTSLNIEVSGRGTTNGQGRGDVPLNSYKLITINQALSFERPIRAQTCRSWCRSTPISRFSSPAMHAVLSCVSFPARRGRGR